jgi:hypothetical protein
VACDLDRVRGIQGLQALYLGQNVR